MNFFAFPPPPLAALDLAFAVECLQTARDALKEADDSGDYQATCELFLRIFGDVLLGVQRGHAPGTEGCRRYLKDFVESGQNPRGLERASLALQFAQASFGDALDRIEESTDLYGPCLAACAVFEQLHTSLDCSLVKRKGFGDRFFGSN